jgi:hypothetical protein
MEQACPLTGAPPAEAQGWPLRPTQAVAVRPHIAPLTMLSPAIPSGISLKTVLSHRVLLCRSATGTQTRICTGLNTRTVSMRHYLRTAILMHTLYIHPPLR